MDRGLWIAALLVVGCSESSTPVDASRADAASIDATSIDAPASDAPLPALDAPGTDAPPGTDAGPGPCDAMDVRMARPCGPTERPGPRWIWNGSECEVVYWCECA